MVPIQLEHISVSQIKMFLACPAQWWFRYVHGLRIPPKGALIRGKAVHAGAEENYIQKIESRKDLPLRRVVDAAVNLFEQDDETDWTDGDKGKTKDEVVGLMTAYHTDIAPLIQPTHVEQEFRLPVGNTEILGYIDVVTEDGYVRDIKTSGKSPYPDVADRSIQLTCYVRAAKQCLGVPVNGVALDYVVSTKKPTTKILTSSRTEADENRFMQIAERVSHAMEEERIIPNPEHQFCNERWCGYWDVCHKTF